MGQTQELLKQPARLTPAELFVRVARSEAEIRAAQKLRYDIFTLEYGATLETDEPGLDRDIYDAHCDHLVVVNNLDGSVVATTRLLQDCQLEGLPGFYSESEFDLTPVHALPGRKLEIGRTCVRADFRNGATLALLWSGLARYMLDQQSDYLIGCASISLRDGNGRVWSITEQLLSRFGVQPEQRITPRHPLPRPAELPSEPAAIPALIKAYIRVGAKIGGEPCWDPDFQCADLFILLPVSALEARYAKHFLGT